LRVFVLDESQLLAWMVGRLSPPGTEVVGLTSFDDARRALLENPPDAAVVSLTSRHLPWREFRQLCADCRPPVPILYESCVFSSAEEAGVESDSGHTRFLTAPASRTNLKEALEQLLDDARRARGRLGFKGTSV